MVCVANERTQAMSREPKFLITEIIGHSFTETGEIILSMKSDGAPIHFAMKRYNAAILAAVARCAADQCKPTPTSRPNH